MEQKSQKTDQQATNAALAALAAAGNSFALGQLWEVNKGLLHRLFWQWYDKNKPITDAAGLTLEDFDQEAIFAVQAVAKAYDPEKGLLYNPSWLLCAKPNQKSGMRGAWPSDNHRGRAGSPHICQPAERMQQP